MLNQFYRDVLPEDGYFCLFNKNTLAHVWADDLDELVAHTEARIDRHGIYFGTAAYGTPTKRKQTNVSSLKSLRLDIDAGADKFKQAPHAAYPTQKEALAACRDFFQATRLAPTYIINSGGGLHIYFAFSKAVTPAQWMQAAKALRQLCDEHDLRVDPTTTLDSARILRPPGTLHPSGRRVSILYTGKTRSYSAVMAMLPEVEEEPAIEEVPDYLRNAEKPDDGDIDGDWEASAIKVAESCGALRRVATTRGDVSEPYWYGMIGVVKHCVEGDDLIHEWSDGHEDYSERATDRKIAQWKQGPTSCEYFARQNPKACAACEHNGALRSPISLGHIKKPLAAPAVVDDGEPDMDEEDIEDAIITRQMEKGSKSTATRRHSDEDGDEDDEDERYEAPKKAASGPWGNALPKGYSVRNNSMWGPLDDGEGGTRIGQFSPNVFWLGPAADATSDQDSAQVVVYVKTPSGVKSFKMEQSLMPSNARLMEFLASRGVHATRVKGASSAMSNYIHEALQVVQNLHRRPRINSHLGMNILDDGRLVAVQGRYVIYPDGTINRPVLSPKLESKASGLIVPVDDNTNGEWDKGVWAETIRPKAERHVDFLRTHYGADEFSKFQLVIMMVLASPLMAFVTGEYRRAGPLPKMSALTLSLYSKETGRGKTTVTQTALAAFGAPGEMTLGASTNDATDLGRMAFLPILGTLPLLMDEMTKNPQSVARTVSSVANGSGRTALNQQGGIRESGAWSLINVMATNYTQRELIQQAQADSDAIQYRVLEVNMDNITPFSLDSQEAFDREWGNVKADCVGALGAEIHQAICAMGVEKVTELTQKCVATAAKILKCTQSARFQFRAMGAMLAVATILNKRGLLPFKLENVVREFKNAYDEGETFNSHMSNASSPQARVGMLLQDLFRNTAITQKLTDRRGGHAPYDLLINERTFQGPAKARYVTDLGITFVETAAFRKWCVEGQLSHSGLATELASLGVLVTPSGAPIDPGKSKEFRFNILRGTELDGRGHVSVFCIDMKRLEEIDPEFKAPEVPKEPAE